MQTYKPAIRWWSLVDSRFIAHFTESLDVTDDRLVLRQGVLSKSETVVPFSRISNYAVKQGIVDRIFGLSNYIIETAGSPQPEIILRGYPWRLKNILSKVLGPRG